MTVQNFSPPQTSTTAKNISTGLVWKAGLLSIAAAVAANLLVSAILIPAMGLSPDFPPYSPISITLFTTIGLFFGLLAFMVLRRFTQNPVRIYTVLALVGMLVSIIPNLGAMANPQGMPFPGSSQDYGVLIVFHVVGALVHLGIFRALLKRYES
jgi:hypothetical protein